MQLNTITNQTIALAGIAQAAALVDQLATMGKVNSTAFESSIGSVLKIDSDNVIDVYGNLSGLKLGLEQLDAQMSGYKIPSHQQARYAASIVFLQNQLANRPDLLKTIHIGLTIAQSQSETFGLLHENVIANLGDLYQRTVSTIEPRIMINGEQHYLSQAEIANKIRAILLAGIRSALLWRQCGGTRWKFLFYRKKIISELHLLLQRA